MIEKAFWAELKMPMKLVLGFFVLGIVGGWIYSWLYPQNTQMLLFQLKERFSALTKDLKEGSLWVIILLNNFEISFLGMALGSLFGIFPLFLALINGAILGFLLNFKISKLSWSYLLAGTLPHGIFELPAVFLALSLGVFLGRAIFKPNWLKNFKLALKLYFKICLPLLLLGALVEAYFTPKILGWLVK